MESSRVASSKFGYVDGLRAAAILAVIGVHVNGHMDHLPFPISLWLGNGSLGVQLFFVASAYTLAMSWDKRNDGAIPFYVRRLFRIAPLFWIGIGFYSILYGQYTAAETIAGATFTAEFYPGFIDSPPPGGTSIQTEMLFYAVFPLMAVSVIRGPLTALLFYGVTLVASRLLNPVLHDLLEPHFDAGDLDNWIFLWLGTQLPVFGMGFLAYHLTRRWPWPLGIASINLLFVAAVVWIAWFALQSATTLVVMGFGVVIYAFANGAGSRLFVAPVRRIGVVSFGMYLWHFFVIEAISRINMPLTGLSYLAAFYLLVLACTFVIAEATYRLVEKPMIELGHRVAAYSASRYRQPASV